MGFKHYSIMRDHYRSDIQGLRAVAVLLVFFSHTHWELFRNGFIGVDVFFVISGYVITQLLLREYRSSGRLVLHRFYARRLQRLLPALAFMLLICTLGSLAVLIPSEQLAQYHAAASAVFWVSNFYFLQADVNYFAPAADENLYLHTWSLGIEEQFYLVWPIILLAGLGFFSRKVVTSSRLITVLRLMFLIGITLYLFLTVTSAARGFYLMPARAWQFALGAMVACWHLGMSGREDLSFPPLILEVLAGTGLLIILGSALWPESGALYLNTGLTIAASAGAALIILAYDHNQSTWISRSLSVKPMRWLGDISYSFYLWHWPVLVFYHHLRPFYPQLNTVVAFAMTLALAMFSYYLVEVPVRKHQRLLLVPKKVIGGALAMMLLVAVSTYMLRTLSVNLATDPVQQKLAAVKTQLPLLYIYGCDSWDSSTQVHACIFGDKYAEKKAVIIGDSVLMQWFPVIAEYFIEQGWQLVALTKSSCPIINRSFYYERIKDTYRVCDVWRAQALQTIIDQKPEMVIMGGAITYPFSKTDFQDGTREVFEQLLPHVRQIKLIAGSPSLGLDGPFCLARSNWLSRILPEVPDSACSRPLRPDKSWQWQREIAAQYPAVEFIELSRHICPGNVCSAKIGNTVVYRDSLHLSAEFVLSLKDVIGAQLIQNRLRVQGE